MRAATHLDRPAICNTCGAPLPPGFEEGRCYSCMFAARRASQDAGPVEGGERPGDRFGHYELLEEVGTGGMGVVWLARQDEPGLRREVALKVIKLGMDTRDVVARFEAERQALAMMDHPGIARVFDAGVTGGGRPYFVMELVRGLPLTYYCDERRLNMRERLGLFAEVCRGVQHAHQKGVIHRDLKPSNILVAEHDGRPAAKVIDFGIAKAVEGKLTAETLTRAPGEVIGTLGYASPEQAGGGRDIDTRSDVYSLGAVLYELLTGRLPFAPERLEEGSLDAALNIIREEDPPKPSTRLSRLNGNGSEVASLRSTDIRKLEQRVSGDLDWIVMMALAKERSRRYQSPSELAQDIERHLNLEPVMASPPSSTYRLGKFVRRHRNAVVAAATMALLLVGGMVVSTWQAVLKENARAGEAGERRKAEKRLTQLGELIEILGSVFRDIHPAKNAEDPRPLQAMLVGNLDVALERLSGDATGDPLVVAKTQHTLGVSLVGLEAPRNAIVALKKAVATREAKLGKEHDDTLHSRDALGRAYHDAGQLDLALPLLEENLELRRKHFPADHPGTLKGINSLAVCSKTDGRLQQAISLYLEVLEQRRVKYPPYHPGVLESTNNLANAYIEQGEPKLARPLLEQVVPLLKQGLGSKHPNTIRALNNLGTVYVGVKEPNLAIPVLEEALALFKEVYGLDANATFRCMGNLGNAHLEAGNLDEALPHLQQALDWQENNLGPEDPSTLRATNNLAALYIEAGKPGPAIPLLEKIVGRMRQNPGPDHPMTLKFTINLGMAYHKNGEAGRAITLLEQNMRRFETRSEPELPAARDNRFNLGMMYKKGARWEQAIPLLENIWSYRNNSLGRDHVDTLWVGANLGICYLEIGRSDDGLPLLEAAQGSMDKHRRLRLMAHEFLNAYAVTGHVSQVTELADKLVDRARKSFPTGGANLASVLARCGGAHLKVGSFELAEDTLRECLGIRVIEIPSSWLTFYTRSSLGGALVGLRDFDQAEPLLVEGYEGMKVREKEIPSGAKHRFIDALERLVEFYERRDEGKTAVYRKLLEQRRQLAGAAY